MPNKTEEVSILAVYCGESMMEDPISEQLDLEKYNITQVNCFDYLPRVLAEGHTVKIILADGLLPLYPNMDEDLRIYHDSLIKLAQNGVDGLGIFMDTYLCKPREANVGPLSVVITDECSKFEIRDWNGLLQKVLFQIKLKNQG